MCRKMSSYKTSSLRAFTKVYDCCKVNRTTIFMFFKVLSDLSGCEYLEGLVTILPSSLYLLHKFARFDRDNFGKYAVCSKCSKLYDMKDCTEFDH